MSFFQDLLAKSKNIVSFSSSVPSVVGIDVGTSAIKIVQVKRSGGKIELETYGELALGSYAQEIAGKVVTLAPEAIATAIKDILREANVTTTAAYLSIQSQATLVFLMELPKVSDAELASIIPNEARKYIPVPITEVSLDWYVIPEKQTYNEASAEYQSNTKIEVVVVAVRNETLVQYREIAEKSGIASRGNEIEVFSAIRSVFHREIAPVVLVDCGASTTKVSVVEYGVVRAYHVINRGSAFISESLARTLNINFDKAEEMKKQVGMIDTLGQEKAADAIRTNMQYIINEIQTVLLQYERQSHKAVTKIILCGGGSALLGFKEKVSETFGLETITGDPFSKVEAPEFMRPILIQAGPEFSVAMGLALKEFI